ncbi:hypothetical protein FRC12_012670 [Ceratobasidium sp. 428]|nr:hypothetical protein FRC12_012670 [Ceratobasidium sp. 428]
MQKCKQDPISRTKGKLRRLLAGGESSTPIDQAPAVSNHGHTQLDPSSAQAPPVVELPPSNHIHDDARTGRPAVAIPIGKPSIPTFQNPGPSQLGASSAQFLEAAPPTLEAVNQSSPAPNRAAFNLPGSTREAIDRPAWSGLEALRGVLRKSVDVFGPLKSAIDGLSQCVEIFEASV